MQQLAPAHYRRRPLSRREFDRAFARLRPALLRHARELTGDVRSARRLVRETSEYLFAERHRLRPDQSLAAWAESTLRARYAHGRLGRAGALAAEAL